MRQGAFYRYLSTILFLLLLLNFFSCKTRKDISSDCLEYIFENKTDLKSYYVKIDSVYESNAQGRFYFIDNNLTMQAECFKASLFKNKCKVKMPDGDVIVLKIKKKSNGRYEGYMLDKRLSQRKVFSFYPYLGGVLQSFDLNRYKHELFDVEKIEDVKYGDVKGFWSSIPDDTIDVGSIVKIGLFNSLKKKDLILDMDIYLPKEDTLSQRPLMMFIHGGAFFIGDKATEPYQKWCTHFASLGYVCVSINYRMGFRINSKAIERTAYQATQDAHAAMRYLLSKKDIYRINPDYLFVGGASAGSITALNLTFMRNEDRPQSSYSSMFLDDLGNLETSGNKLYNKFRIKAVANLWGAIYDLEILKNTKASIISFHGDKDVILPYRFGYPFRALGEFKKVFFDEMYGSSYIHETASNLGLRSELHTFSGQGHTLHLDENRQLNNNFYTIQNYIVDFFYEELIPYPVRIFQDESDSKIFTIDTTDVAVADWSVIGGFIKEETKGKVEASWFDDEVLHELKVSGYYKNGTGFSDVFLIKDIDSNEDNSHK